MMKVYLDPSEVTTIADVPIADVFAVEKFAYFLICFFVEFSENFLFTSNTHK